MYERTKLIPFCLCVVSSALRALQPVAPGVQPVREAVEREQRPHDAAQRLRLWRAGGYFFFNYESESLSEASCTSTAPCVSHVRS